MVASGWCSRTAIVVSLIVGISALPGAAQSPAAPPAEPSLTPQDTFARIVERFRSRRMPAFVSYTLKRKQLSRAGTPDYPNNYTKHFWVRTSDRAALSRVVYRTRDGELAFDRPAFNEARDPGPPTFDFFDGVDATTYVAQAVALEGPVVHVSVHPALAPDRNRLREIFADKQTYELRKLIVADTLFVQRGPVYPVTMTITMTDLNGMPVVREAHGEVGGGFNDGRTVDYTFEDIAFPSALPDWYFTPSEYGRHAAEAPL